MPNNRLESIVLILGLLFAMPTITGCDSSDKRLIPGNKKIIQDPIKYPTDTIPGDTFPRDSIPETSPRDSMPSPQQDQERIWGSYPIFPEHRGEICLSSNNSYFIV